MMVSYSIGVNRDRDRWRSGAVVGPFDPGDDRGPELLPGGPGTAVEDVVLQQAENDSMAALSPAAPTLPTDPIRWCRLRARTNFRLRNCDPRSVCSTQPATSPRRATALWTAVRASRDFILESIEYPTIQLDHTSLIAHKCSLPSPVRVLGDIGQPQSIRAADGEVTAHRVVHRRARPTFLAPALFAAERAEPAHLRADFHAVRSTIGSPAARASSAMNR